jgi:hypothetical protein
VLPSKLNDENQCPIQFVLNVVCHIHLEHL